MKAEVIREIAEKRMRAIYEASDRKPEGFLYDANVARSAREIAAAIYLVKTIGFVVLPKEELEAALKIVSAAEWIWRANDAHTNRIALRGAESSSRDECNTALANLVTEFTADDFRRAAALLAAITEEGRG